MARYLPPAFSYLGSAPGAGEGYPVTYDPHDIAIAGARLTLVYDGTVQVERGSRRAAEQAEAEDAPAVPTYSDALTADLTAHKTAAMLLEMTKRPMVALAATVHALGISLLYSAWGRTSLGLSGKSDPLERHVAWLEECSAHAALAAVIGAWQESFPADLDGFWDWCLAAGQDRLVELLAVLAGMTVDAATGRTSGALAQALELDMHDHWPPVLDGFYGRLSKPLIVKVLTEVGAHDDAAKVAGLKKNEAAAVTAAKLTADGWLPAALV